MDVVLSLGFRRVSESPGSVHLGERTFRRWTRPSGRASSVECSGNDYFAEA